MLTGAGHRRAHGLTSPLHDAGVPKPIKITKVTVLPDATESDMEWSSAPIRSGATRPASLAKPKRPRAAPRKVVAKPVVQTGPSAIEKIVVRRSSRAVITRPPVEETHLTAEGLDELRAELEELTTLRRPEVIARIKAARELGDLRENADYESARKEQSFLEGRVQQLQQTIKFAVIIEHGAESGAEVTLGATVVVETDRHGQETFTIVGSAEADASAGKISYTSPIGRALMGRRPGETIRVEIPSGTLDFKVTEVH
jgi:transcription elongation factor GreA